ncbi:hypothetical protein FHT36_001734 [Xanthobacter sp. SG618]|uniref:hypothetical protein n=1 Tax=Xanthobacter sp. SG618 TaxID=2587121 RepID=UPI00145EE3B1|nr:hypothetical protein [Xanthobacter sp. SG618]NMN57837.1 hypothetical protein [Xanthobacter sp. SG618]
MYFASDYGVNAAITGLGNLWLFFVATTGGLRQDGGFHTFVEALLVAMGER